MSGRPVDVEDRGFDTRAIYAGRDPSCSSMPIYMANTGADFYTSQQNPTTDALEACLASLEGGGRAISTASGMAAITQTFLALLGSGDRIVTHRCVYDWVDTFMSHSAPKMGVETAQLDFRDIDALKRELETPTKVVHFEPVANPSFEVIDVEEVVRAAHEAGSKVVVDNTWLTPALLRPLELGADVVVHACTKYMCGHGDALGGAVVSRDDNFMDELFYTKSIFGGTMSPFNAYNILRGLSTLSIRMKQHCENAHRVAEFLAGHPAVAETRYPGLPSDPHHETAKAMLQNRGFGGMIGFVVDGGDRSQRAFIDALELCRPWVSLGDSYTHAYARWMEARKGVPEGLIRMAIGLEDVGDVISDLDQALNRMSCRR